MTRKNVRITRNKNIRKDLVEILEKESPLTASELVPRLLKMNPNRTITIHQVGQILRVKEFEKAEVMPTLTAKWKLSEG
jgi:hypothetical protein